MLQRVVTGVLAAAIALAAILWREPWGFLALCLLVLIWGVLELRPFAWNCHYWLAAVGATVLVPFLVQQSTLYKFIELGAFWTAGALGLLLWSPKHRLWSIGLYFWLWTGVFTAIELKAFQPDPADFAWSILLIAIVPLWVGDSLAYFVGKAIGKHKLAPRVSPNKTWEGAIANLIGCLLTSCAIGQWFALPLQVGLTVGLITGILGQVGDLLQSRIKRLAEVKDSGSILPGHGGVLDRLDSFLFSSYPSLLALYLLAPDEFHVKQWPW